jgi:hypothetical protein
MQKSYNQLYKESGTTLSYKDWRKREDEKMASFDAIPTPNIKDSVKYQDLQKELLVRQGYKTEISNKTVFGLNKYYFVIGGILILSAIGYNIYKKRKS